METVGSKGSRFREKGAVSRKRRQTNLVATAGTCPPRRHSAWKPTQLGAVSAGTGTGPHTTITITVVPTATREHGPQGVLKTPQVITRPWKL